MKHLIYFALIICFISCDKSNPGDVEQFVKTWHTDNFCNQGSMDIIITKGSSENELIISGQISVIVTGNTFYSESTGEIIIIHRGEIINKSLHYCQEAHVSDPPIVVECCGIFN